MKCENCKRFKKADNCILCKQEIEDKLTAIKNLITSKNAGNAVADIVDQKLTEF